MHVHKLVVGSTDQDDSKVIYANVDWPFRSIVTTTRIKPEDQTIWIFKSCNKHAKLRGLIDADTDPERIMLCYLVAGINNVTTMYKWWESYFHVVGLKCQAIKLLVTG